MANANTQCPPADVIAAFAFGELSAANGADVQSHVSECEVCLETVGHLARSTRTGGGSNQEGANAPIDAAEPALSESGQLIGSYRLVQPLGAGGMGEVWKAEQLAPVRRTVALKLLKPGMDTRQILARFETERQMLALMQHPSIAQIFDAGITRAGRPYFVMEYVDGERITGYCDQAGLGIAERLELFQQVCEAVQHAHQKGVIHRDLKPSNVLVTLQNGRAVPKVIDFGLAKLSLPDVPDATLTEMGTVLGTPAYASPEQMSPGVIDVDTRSDVYSLGVILFELLAGVIPFEVDGAQPAAVIELRRNIREMEPVRPSARVSRLGVRASEIAQRRGGLAADVLRRQLRGDLDWIVLKALEKDRSRRYTSPGDLARDTQRYLQHEPVLAGSPAATYRVRKFVRRNRTATAFGVVVFSLVVAFAITSVVQLKHIAAERDRATLEAEKASSINAFLLETLGSADPWQSGGNISLRDTLKQAAAKIDTSFKGEPLVAAGVRRTIGKTYVSLGRFDDAQPLLASALDTRVKLLGHASAEAAESLGDQAALLQARGDYDKAISISREVLARRRKLFGNNHALVADSLLDLATSLNSKGEYAEGARVANEALVVRERLSGPQSVEVAVALITLSNSIEAQGDYVRTVQLIQRAYDIRRKLLPADDIRIAEVEGVLGADYYLQRKYSEAEALYRRSLQSLMRVLGKNHPQTLEAMENLAGALSSLHRYDESVGLMTEVLERRRSVLGENSPQVARTMVNLAQVLSRGGKAEESSRAFAEAVPRFAKAYGEQHPEYGIVLMMYAIALNRSRHFAQAEPIARQAVAHNVSSYTDDHQMTAQSKLVLAIALTAGGKFAEAESLLLSARPVTQKSMGVESAQWKALLDAQAELYAAWGKRDKAVEIKQQLAAMAKQAS